jgi:uncharacterized protein YkwD
LCSRILHFTTAVIAFTLFCSFTRDTAAADAGDGTHYRSAPASIDRQKLLNLVNEARGRGCNCGNEYFPPVSPVYWNDKLEIAAVNHSNWMAKNNYLSHPEDNGSTAGDRIKAAGYTWRTYGENIAAGYPTEEEVIQGWLKSEHHCKNIMNGNFKEMGIAASGSFWTQVFAAGR